MGAVPHDFRALYEEHVEYVWSSLRRLGVHAAHVEDIAQAIGAAIAQRADGVFNITDDEPTPQGVPVAFAAELLGVAPPHEVAFDEATKAMSPMALSFYAESKRVRNDKLKRALGVLLRCPTYREGLRALFARREGSEAR